MNENMSFRYSYFDERANLEVHTSLPSPNFETAFWEFLDFAVKVYGWERRDVKSQVIDALGQWET